MKNKLETLRKISLINGKDKRVYVSSDLLNAEDDTFVADFSSLKNDEEFPVDMVMNGSFFSVNKDLPPNSIQLKHTICENNFEVTYKLV